jgi:signal transduction histidine kinase/ligand-binding sensor domain-containing protein
MIDIENQIQRVTQIEFLENERPFDIKCDSEGIIWYTTNLYNIYSYEPKTQQILMWSLSNFFPNTNNSDPWLIIEMDNMDQPWISSQGGIINFNRSKSGFEFLKLADGEENINAWVMALSFDNQGNTWIGTNNHGLFKYVDKTNFHSLVHNPDDENSITGGWAFNIFEDNDGIVWIQTPNGYNRFNPVTNELSPYSIISDDPTMQSVYLTDELFPGKILAWSAEYDGWVLYDDEEESYVRFKPKGFPQRDLYVTNIYHDSRNNIWFCTDKGLYQMKSDHRDEVIYYDLAMVNGVENNYNLINAFEDDAYGLWLWGDAGLFLFDYETKEIKRIAYDIETGDILPARDINAFYKDNRGIYWVGTWQGGLCQYDPGSGKITTFTTKDGLVSDIVMGIVEDEKNNALWISTFSGISRFDLETKTFYNYNLDDGLQGLMYSEIAQLKTSGGLIIFGGNNGITWFDPDKISHSSKSPRISFTNIIVDNTSLMADLFLSNRDNENQVKPLLLSYDNNNFSIEYNGIQYDNPTKNKFAYQLVNYDKDWRHVNNSRSAFYFNIPPGEYTFQVKAANSNGVWSDPLSLMITIDPPWWFTWWAYIIYGLIFMAVVFAVDKIQRRRVINKERELARNKELEQAREIEKAYKELKNTQAQLIQSEKMASLGELTAGIAHEIQNPLNFVNNFSEVSLDLIKELKEERDKIKGINDKNDSEPGKLKEVSSNNEENEVRNETKTSDAEMSFEEDIFKDIYNNLKKIHSHGNRASSIVKGMLQHSSTQAKEKELTDINALADEYLRLAYHGLRAKDKSFNADFLTDFEKSLPKIKVIPQDLGRVLLNLINNAFYAVDKKSKEGIDGYKPEVVISTGASRSGGSQGEKGIEILVKDNGHGIPQNIKDKIFQPFYTTKPTGQGTGLGLSLSYDIMKAHGGEIHMKSNKGEGTEFTIILPTD